MAQTKKQPKQPKKPGAPSSWTGRGTAVVVVAVVVGLGIGAALTKLLPEGGLFAADRARFHLVKDSAGSLQDAADLADGADTTLNGIGALARVLLWLEHGAADDERVAAEKLLIKASAGARTSGEGLYARALLASLPPSKRPLLDARLDDDLKAARASASSSSASSSTTLLALALRTADAAERRALVEKAALGKDPTPHATHVLARTLLAQGDLPSARAALDRLFRLDDKHVAGAVTAVVAGIIEDATLPPEQRARSRRPKNQGAPRPGQPAGAAVVSVDEARLRELFDDGVDDLDEDQLAIVLLALELARSSEADKELVERATTAATRTGQNAERLLELLLCDGDVDAADAVVVAAVKARAGIPSLPLLVDVSRARFLRALPDEERRAARKGSRAIGARGLKLPVGTLAFSFAHSDSSGDVGGGGDVVDLGLPWQAMPDAGVFPEQRYRQVQAAVEAGGAAPSAGDKLDARLTVVEKLALAERATARGDLGSALTLVTQARDPGSSGAALDPAGAADVALADAAVRSRQNDVAGVKGALDSAVAAAPDDPRVLLAAARLAAESDNPQNLASARRALAQFKRLGFKSAPAAAIEAMIEARSGDAPAARAALAEARRLAPPDDDDALLLRATLLANRNFDVAEARRAAGRLLELNDNGGGDVVGAWLAEAAFRKGEQPRAEAALKAIIDLPAVARGGAIAEAHLFYAQSIAFNPARKKEAYGEALKALDKLPGGPLVDEAKRLALVLKRR